MQKIALKFHRRNSPLRARESGPGQVMVLICLAIITIMGLIGLVADVGSLQAHKQSMQTAADSAALAAGQELAYGDSVVAGGGRATPYRGYKRAKRGGGN